MNSYMKRYTGQGARVFLGTSVLMESGFTTLLVHQYVHQQGSSPRSHHCEFLSRIHYVDVIKLLTIGD